MGSSWAACGPKLALAAAASFSTTRGNTTSVSSSGEIDTQLMDSLYKGTMWVASSSGPTVFLQITPGSQKNRMYLCKLHNEAIYYGACNKYEGLKFISFLYLFLKTALTNIKLSILMHSEFDINIQSTNSIFNYLYPTVIFFNIQ